MKYESDLILCFSNVKIFYFAVLSPIFEGLIESFPLDSFHQSVKRRLTIFFLTIETDGHRGSCHSSPPPVHLPSPFTNLHLLSSS